MKLKVYQDLHREEIQRKLGIEKKETIEYEKLCNRCEKCPDKKTYRNVLTRKTLQKCMSCEVTAHCIWVDLAVTEPYTNPPDICMGCPVQEVIYETITSSALDLELEEEEDE